MIIDSLIWSHLQQTLRVYQTCYRYCRLWCRLLSTIANCSSRQLQVNWTSSARILFDSTSWPISCTFRIWMFRWTCYFKDNSSCNRACSRPVSTNPCCASCDDNLCSSVYRCSSPMHLFVEGYNSCSANLPDWASDPDYFHEDILSNSTDLRFWTQNSWSNFPAPMKTMHRVPPRNFWPSDVWDLKLSFRSTWVFCALTCLSCMTFALGFPKLSGIQMWSQHLLWLDLRGHNLQFFLRNRRSECAIGSRTSLAF